MKSNPFSLFAAAAITSVLALSSFAFAAPQTWIDTNANNTWDITQLNWNPGPAIWTNGNDAIFGGTAETVTLGTAITATSVAFNTTGYILALANNTLTTGSLNYGGAAAGTLTATGTSGTASAQNVITLGGAGSGWASGTSVALTGAGNPGVGSTQNGALLKLVLGDATALGSAEIKVKHAMIQTGAAGMTVTNAITNAGASLYFGGEFDFNVSGLIKGDGNNNRTIGVWAGSGGSRTITLGNLDTVGTGLFNFEARGGANPNPGGGFIVNGAITGAGGVSTVGTGQFAGNTLTLNGANDYTGATTMVSGRLQLNGSLTSAVTISTGASISGPGSTTGLLTLNGGSILSLPGGATTASLTSAGITFAGVPNVVFATTPVEFTVYDVLTYGAGTVTNDFNLSVPYRGTLTDTGTKFTFTSGAFGQTRTWDTTTGNWDAGTTANWFEGDNLFYAGDTVIFNDPAEDSVVTLVGPLAPASVTVNNVNAYTFTAGSITGSTGLAKSGGGTLTLTGTNTYTGTTTINNGTVIVNGTAGFTTNGSRIGNNVVVNSGGTLQTNLFHQFGWTGTLANLTVNDGGTFNQNSYDQYLGTLTLNGNASITNGSANYLGLSSGVVNYTGTGSQQATVTSRLNLQNSSSTAVNATFTINGTNAAGDLVVSGTIMTGGGLTKAGTGTLVLSGANTYTGATTVSNGTFALVGGSQKSAITVSGAAALGFNPATPTISTAAVTFNSGATVTILGTPAAATLMTAVSFTGTPVLSPAISGYALDTTTPGQLKLVATGGGGYAAYATANAGGGPFTGDFDNDGVSNGLEYFMGATGSSFTPNPALIGGTVSYPRDSSVTDVTFKVTTSTNLVTWTDVTASADISDPNFVKYTPATGLGKVFVRLEVTQN